MVESLEVTRKQSLHKGLESLRSDTSRYLSADFLSKKMLGLDVWARHKWAMSKLRRVFPADLIDPKNKIINIEDKGGDLRNFKITLYNYCVGDNSYTSMTVCNDDCGIEIYKDGDFWDSRLIEYMEGACRFVRGHINYSKFYKGVNEIIKHRDQYKVNVESVFVDDGEKSEN